MYSEIEAVNCNLVKINTVDWAISNEDLMNPRLDFFKDCVIENQGQVLIPSKYLENEQIIQLRELTDGNPSIQIMLDLNLHSGYVKYSLKHKSYMSEVEFSTLAEAINIVNDLKSK